MMVVHIPQIWGYVKHFVELENYDKAKIDQNRDLKDYRLYLIREMFFGIDLIWEHKINDESL